MRVPIAWDLFGDRGVPFADTLPIVGRDFAGAAFSSQVRAVADAPGAAIKTLAVALTYGGSDTVANHVSAGRIGPNIYDFVNPATQAKYEPTDVIPLSVVNVSAADMTTGIPAGKPTGADVMLAWDMLIDPAGADPQDKWITGSFTVRGTVTQ